MTRQFFNTAAACAQPYVFDFDHEAAAFYRDHPMQKEKIYFVDASAMPGAVCCGNAANEDKASARLGKNAYLYTAVQDTYETGKGGAVRFDEEGYSCVILKLPRNQTDVGLLGYDTPSDIADVFSFDHEIGHLICPNGYDGDPLMKECIADAYAVIRHIQRFGAQSSFIGNLTGMRAVEMILGRDGSHFTAPVVEKIIADAQTTDFSTLTPAETVVRAQRYAVENAIDPGFVSFMENRFNALPFKPVDILEGKLGAVRKLGQFVLETNIPEEFKWGATALRALLDGNVGVDGVRLPKPVGPEWALLRRRIYERAARFGQPKLIVVSDMKL